MLLLLLSLGRLLLILLFLMLFVLLLHHHLLEICVCCRGLVANLRFEGAQGLFGVQKGLVLGRFFRLPVLKLQLQ